AGSFYHLLDDHESKLRVCTGLSCAMRGSREILSAAKAAGLPVVSCSCLAACDRAPALLRDRSVLVEVSVDDIEAAQGDWEKVSGTELSEDWCGQIGPADDSLPMNLAGTKSFAGDAFAKALEMGGDKVIDAIDDAGLQGRGGAGFPAAIKWRGVRAQSASPHYVVLNADEGEPGTFKDRELMLRRPDLVLEGLAIAAITLGASDVYLYLRGEFRGPWIALEKAIASFSDTGLFEGVNFHLHAGHGAYICGEETALLEALEGKRGMPRIKPPFPTECGLWGKPTLIQNVETIACLPDIVLRGGSRFKALGKTEPGSKLYSVSGDVACPGTYELPLGSTLDELAVAAGGYVGELLGFSPGGASSGFLPASARDCPLDFKSLGELGSMLGSAGVVVLNTEVDIPSAVRDQLVFFENESCGQCAPCRIGTRFLREALDTGKKSKMSHRSLAQVAEVAWEMNEGSICGLGQAAPLPLTSALRHFPDHFPNHSPVDTTNSEDN
ncbi:MAG: SLBB domain-containing protein, partial [Kofleriaceae bacterium]|nr:SLBB domain-containing protein [Kofleriaceae bacterium]